MKFKKKKQQRKPLYQIAKSDKDPANIGFIKTGRMLFIQGHSAESIIALTGIPPHVLKLYFPEWRKLRKKLDSSLLEAIRKESDTVKQAKMILDKGMYFANLYMNKLMSQGLEKVEPKDFKLVMDAVFGIHKIHRLENNESTDILDYGNMKPEEITTFIINQHKELNEKYPELLPQLPIIEVKPNE